jgi:hypothetical protein
MKTAITDEFDGLEDEQVQELKRECVVHFIIFRSLTCDLARWQRSHTALQELCLLLPNFRKKIDEGNPEELSEYYSKVCCTVSIL